jgi:23S rRNA (uracil1939-C5)-methyltransferase
VNHKVEIHSLSHDGRGIGTINNKTAFVSAALKNELVNCTITRTHSRYVEADAIEILRASLDRALPPCPHFGICGGCSLQHMNMQAQIALKQQTLLDQLQHFGGLKPHTILPPLNAHTLGYRRKARLGVKFVIKKNKLLVGFREKSSSYLADLSQCKTLHPAVGERLEELSTLIASLAAYRTIPQIEVAIGDHELALVFRHLEALADTDKETLIQFGKKNKIHIYLQANPPTLVKRLWPEQGPERLTYTLPDEELTFLFHPLDFTQINLGLNRLMVQQALSLLELNKEDKVLDLFCGIGNFTLPMAKKSAQVTGIEGSKEMIERAIDNAHYNNINNVNFHVANLMAPQSAAWMNTHYHKILLDPPRAGAKEILPYFKSFKAEKIVYVSCNPATLARDAGELVSEYGYTLKQAGIMNMFPHTAHIEAMAVFEKT